MDIILIYCFENGSYKAESFNYISELVDFLKKNIITSLYLGGNKLGKEGAEALVPALKKMKNLTSLDLSRNNLGKEGTEALVLALQEIKSLTSLNLSWNGLGKEGAEALVPALQEMKNLTSLNLSCNGLGKEGAEALAPALQEMKNLNSLYLSGNNLGKEGAEALVPALQEMKNLTSLNLSWNDLGKEDAQKLANELPGCKVHVSENCYTAQIPANHASNGDPLPQKGNGNIQVPALKEINNLTSLNLSENDSGKEDAQKLANELPGCKVHVSENCYIAQIPANHASNGDPLPQKGNGNIQVPALQEMKNLTSLNLSWNDLGKEDAQKLANELPGCKVHVSENCYTAQIPANHASNGDPLPQKGNGNIQVPALKEINNLTSLNLSENDSGKEDAQKLANELPGCKVHVSENCYIAQIPANHASNGDPLPQKGNGNIQVPALQEMKNLTSLDLSWNDLEKKGAQKLENELPGCKVHVSENCYTAKIPANHASDGDPLPKKGNGNIQKSNYTIYGTIAGLVLGAVLGGVIAYAFGSATLGIIGGAAAGALLGILVVHCIAKARVDDADITKHTGKEQPQSVEACAPR